ncbi:hypothetical protein [Enterococcus hermanniensis]|uniref:Uncharacterized protein n=1 Tax=Enterococcus hermanniensis TaxID=249189 RepID=A0A1L8TPG9_9ENTE|nr:hypothetical protein [Enterococcus hermanniensis]OJG46170.1 hypothetical protein RV04_GL001336 [Enterococcus hermanniensis]
MGSSIAPKILLAIIIICLIIFFFWRWSNKKKQQKAERTEAITVPEKTNDIVAIIEASIQTMQSYKNNLNKYGYVYFQETTPFVVQQLKAEADSLLVAERENQKILIQLQNNYKKLENFYQSEATDPKKTELEVLNHVNKTMITWRNLLKENR